jgi:hypothetical protein
MSRREEFLFGTNTGSCIIHRIKEYNEVFSGDQPSQTKSPKHWKFIPYYFSTVI